MKMIGRILIILAVFALVMGVTYVIVNASSSSVAGGMPAFEQGNRRLAPANGARPEFPGRERNEFRGGRNGGGMLLGAIKNIVIVGFIVVFVVLPKSWMQKRKRAAQASVG